jgi:hypothetical protein
MIGQALAPVRELLDVFVRLIRGLKEPHMLAEKFADCPL